MLAADQDELLGLAGGGGGGGGGAKSTKKTSQATFLIPLIRITFGSFS